MEDHTPPTITSFIIRFVHDGLTPAGKAPISGQTSYRGFIRHIQSNKELSFTDWEDAMVFMGKYITQLEKESLAGRSNNNKAL